MREWLGNPKHPGAPARGLDSEVAGRLHVGLQSCASLELLLRLIGRKEGSAASSASPGPGKGKKLADLHKRSGRSLEL